MAGTRLVIAGATGEVGTALLSALEDADLPIAEMHALASPESVEETVMFKGRALLVESLDDFDFQRADIAVFAVPAEQSLRHVPRARAAGCRVIDHSEAYRLDEEVPLAVAGAVPEGDLIACPGPLAALLVPVLQALVALAPVASVQATLLSPVSLLGRAGVRELAGQTGELLNARGITPSVFPAQIAFNTLPVVGEAGGNRLMDELERLLPTPVPVALAEVRVPVFYGMTLGLSVQTGRDIAVEAAVAALEKAGVKLADLEKDQQLATPVSHASGVPDITLVELRELPAPLQGLQLWLLADNVRQGAVSQTVAVLSKWIKRL